MVPGVDQRAVVGLEQPAHVDRADHRGVDRHPVRRGVPVQVRVAGAHPRRPTSRPRRSPACPTGVSGIRIGLRQGDGGGAQRDQLDRHAGSLPRRTRPRPESGRAALWRCEHMFGTVERMAEYAELHCHSNFSFLDGASHPEELAEEAHRLGLSAPRGHRPRRALRRGPLRGGGAPARPAHGLRRGADPRASSRPPVGHAGSGGGAPRGHRRRARGLRRRWPARSARRRCAARRARRATRSRTWPTRRAGRSHWWALTGCRKGAVPAALVRDGPAAAERALGPADRRVRPGPRARGALGSRRPDGPAAQRRAGAARGAHRGRGGRHEQRPLRDAGPAPARVRARRRSAAGAASTSSTAGCPPLRSRTCAARPSSSGASPAIPARSSAPRRSRPRARSTCGSRCRTCPTTRCRKGTPT